MHQRRGSQEEGRGDRVDGGGEPGISGVFCVEKLDRVLLYREGGKRGKWSRVVAEL